MMPCSGLMPITSSTPMRWAHRNCIEPASCWRPSRRPRTEACTRVDLRGRLPNRKADHFLNGQNRSSAAHPACAKPLDWDDHVTEVLSLEGYASLSRKGLFVYDWTDVHKTDSERYEAYELVATPTVRIYKSDLNGSLAKLAAKVVISISDFSEEKSIRVEAN